MLGNEHCDRGDLVSGEFHIDHVDVFVQMLRADRAGYRQRARCAVQLPGQCNLPQSDAACRGDRVERGANQRAFLSDWQSSEMPRREDDAVLFRQRARTAAPMRIATL